jgi:hypothetical protein
MLLCLVNGSRVEKNGADWISLSVKNRCFIYCRHRFCHSNNVTKYTNRDICTRYNSHLSNTGNGHNIYKYCAEQCTMLYTFPVSSYFFPKHYLYSTVYPVPTDQIVMHWLKKLHSKLDLCQ